MSFLYIYLISLSMPIVTDSVVYSIDFDAMNVIEHRFKQPIIDCSVDEFLYLLTSRFLWKVDPDNLVIRDRIPLPQKFNYLATDDKNLMLFVPGEVIILNKSNFSYKTGVGLEYGDHRPLVTLHGRFIFNKNNQIYLITEAGNENIMKIFNAQTGELLRKITVDKILHYIYDYEANVLATLDINNDLIIYDQMLRQKTTIKVPIKGNKFIPYENGYMIFSKHGIHYINSKGLLVDYQPIEHFDNSHFARYLFLSEDNFVFIDSLTIRPRSVIYNKHSIGKLFEVDFSDYVLGLDTHNQFHLIGLNDFQINPIYKKRPAITGVAPEIKNTRVDSLWYFQIGAFSSYQNALGIYSEYRQKNIPVFIDSISLYRIKIGGFREKREAVPIIESLDLEGWFLYQKRFTNREIIEFKINSHNYVFEEGIIHRRF